MTTLVKRATPSQRRIMRAVEGAIRNTMHAHPDWKIPWAMPRSAAKRAAGTLASQWGDVLAATKPSRKDRVAAVTARSADGSGLAMPSGRGMCRSPAHPPLRRLIAKLSKPLRRLKQEDPLRAEVYIDVLRMIDRMKEE